MLNDLEPDYLKLIVSLVKDEINYEKYSIKRGLKPRLKLNEVKYLLTANPILLNIFLGKLTIGARCLVMKSIFDLNDRQLVELSREYNSKSSIGNFIKNNLTNESKDLSIKSVKTSMDFVNDLSIILDIPSRFLANPNTVYKMTSAFDEYDQEKVQKVTFKELIEDALCKTRKMIGEQRTVFGVKIIHNDFILLDEGLVNTRVDIRAKYFTIECHFKNEASVSYSNILKLRKIIGRRSEIYIRNAFLRTNKKLIILIASDNFVIPNISYLDKESRVDQLFSLDNILSKRLEE